MFEVELDIYSGMPNPRWILSEKEEQELMEQIAAEPAQVSAVDSAEEQFSLGYRGMIVRLIKTTDAAGGMAPMFAGRPLPQEFRIGSRPAKDAPIAEWLLHTSEKPFKHSQVTDELRAVVSEGVALVESCRRAADPAAGVVQLAAEDAGSEMSRFPTLTGEGAHAPDPCGAAGDISPQGATWWACGSNFFAANAGVFNRPENVGRNNCYCFASNHLAGVRYALPGRRGGRPATSITCAGVTAGLYADGWRDGCQQNALTIVLVIWPGYDYHFYRLVTGGPNWWWGHKPGGTPAKYTDDCGNAIYQSGGRGYAPNNCCRGRYVDFCGYFYQNNSTAFVA